MPPRTFLGTLALAGLIAGLCVAGAAAQPAPGGRGAVDPTCDP